MLKNIKKKKKDEKTLGKNEDYFNPSKGGTNAASKIRKNNSKTKIDPNKDTAEEINIILKD